jgi:thymidylate kinase
VAQGLGIETVLSVNHDAIRDVLPDMVIYMDMPIDIALARTFDAA